MTQKRRKRAVRPPGTNANPCGSTGKSCLADVYVKIQKLKRRHAFGGEWTPSPPTLFRSSSFPFLSFLLLKISHKIFIGGVGRKESKCNIICKEQLYCICIRTVIVIITTVASIVKKLVMVLSRRKNPSILRASGR